MSIISREYVELEPLPPDECLALADTQGESPETVAPVHVLRRGLCSAYVVGEPTRFDAAIVIHNSIPEEPFGFGDDARALWNILEPLKGWRVVDVSQAVAPKLGALIREAIGKRVTYYGDVYHTLTGSAAEHSHPDVRRLTSDDLPLFNAAPSQLQGDGFGSKAGLLRDGIVAGAVVDGRLVGIAHTNAITDF